eukprot:gene1304-1422_t
MKFFSAVYISVIQPYLKDVPLLYSTRGAIVAMFFLVYLSKLAHAATCLLLQGKYDNVQSSHRYEGKNDGSWTWQRLTSQRAFSAHMNQWEAFIGFFAATILALIYAPVEKQEELTLLANAFLCTRVLYNVVYIFAFNVPLSVVRSAVWTVGLVLLIKIFSLAVPDLAL